MEDKHEVGYKISTDMGRSQVTQVHDGKKTTIKNFKGDLGAICNYCSGLGFTNTIGGGALGCMRCQQTGIEPVNMYELKAQVDELTNLVKKLVEKQNG